MITDKDKSEIKRYIVKAPVFSHLELVERPYGDLVKYDDHVRLVAESYNQGRKDATSDAMGYGISGDERERIRAESAEQARKEASERARRAIMAIRAGLLHKAMAAEVAERAILNKPHEDKIEGKESEQ